MHVRMYNYAWYRWLLILCSPPNLHFGSQSDCKPKQLCQCKQEAQKKNKERKQQAP